MTRRSRRATEARTASEGASVSLPRPVPILHVSFATIGGSGARAGMALIGAPSPRLKAVIFFRLSADALQAYVFAVQAAFGADDVDFAKIVKIYSRTERLKAASSRYRPGDVVNVRKACVFANPAWDRVSTSYVERQNRHPEHAGMRFSVRRNGPHHGTIRRQDRMGWRTRGL